MHKFLSTISTRQFRVASVMRLRQLYAPLLNFVSNLYYVSVSHPLQWPDLRMGVWHGKTTSKGACAHLWAEGHGLGPGHNIWLDVQP